MKDRPYIFISYAREDEKRVMPTIEYLQGQGFWVWYDQEGIPAGKDWAEYIGEHIEESECVLAFMSGNYDSSQNCYEEICLAKDEGKTILPIYLEDVKLKVRLRMRISYLNKLEPWKKYKNKEFDEKFWEELSKESVLQPCKKGEKNDVIDTSAVQIASDKKENNNEKVKKAATVEDGISDQNKQDDFLSQEEIKVLVSAMLEEIQLGKQSINSLASKNIGDTITFGRYRQSKDLFAGKEAIRWKVLDKKDGELLIISEKVLDVQQYHTKWESVTWETCSLRSWLNKEFLSEAFTEEEQKQIMQKNITNPYNPDWNTPGGNDTKDQIFLLSIQEVKEYYKSGDERKAEATNYASASGSWWWLRSPGSSSRTAAGVSYVGGVDINGSIVNIIDVGIRPALWIKS